MKPPVEPLPPINNPIPGSKPDRVSVSVVFLNCCCTSSISFIPTCIIQIQLSRLIFKDEPKIQRIKKFKRRSVVALHFKSNGPIRFDRLWHLFNII